MMKKEFVSPTVEAYLYCVEKGFIGSIGDSGSVSGSFGSGYGDEDNADAW